MLEVNKFNKGLSAYWPVLGGGGGTGSFCFMPKVVGSSAPTLKNSVGTLFGPFLSPLTLELVLSVCLPMVHFADFFPENSPTVFVKRWLLLKS